MSASRCTFRVATVADVPALAELRAEFTNEDLTGSEQPRSDFSEAFASIVGAGIGGGRWTVWVAEAETVIVAHAFVGLLEKIPRPVREQRWVGYLTNVYTRPTHRGQGVGTALLEHVLDWARRQSVEVLVVWPSDDSIPFYERLGFATERDPFVWAPIAPTEGA